MVGMMAGKLAGEQAVKMVEQLDFQEVDEMVLKKVVEMEIRSVFP